MVSSYDIFFSIWHECHLLDQMQEEVKTSSYSNLKKFTLCCFVIRFKKIVIVIVFIKMFYLICKYLCSGQMLAHLLQIFLLQKVVYFPLFEWQKLVINLSSTWTSHSWTSWNWELYDLEIGTEQAHWEMISDTFAIWFHMDERVHAESWTFYSFSLFLDVQVRALYCV